MNREPSVPTPSVIEEPVPVIPTSTHASLQSRAFTTAYVLAAIVLVSIVLWSPARRLYDEQLYFAELDALEKAPALFEHLRSGYQMAPGPLHALVHWLLQPVTGLDPKYARLANLLMAAGILVLLWRSDSRPAIHSKSPLPPWPALLLSVPPFWVMSGLALTEVPSMLFLCAALYVLLAGEPNEQGWVRFIVASLCLGLACVGRQPYLLCVPFVAWLMWSRRKSIAGVLALVVAALLLPALLFALWGALTPPLQQHTSRGFVLEHGILSLAYCGLFLVLMAPSWLGGVRRKWIALAAIAGVAANLAFLHMHHAILGKGIRGLLPETIAERGDLIGGCGLVAMALAVIVAFAFHCYDRRHDACYIGMCVTSLALVCSAALISHNFSAKYPAAALPFLAWIADCHRTYGAREWCANVAGAVLGAFSLVSYIATSG